MTGELVATTVAVVATAAAATILAIACLRVWRLGDAGTSTEADGEGSPEGVGEGSPEGVGSEFVRQRSARFRLSMTPDADLEFLGEAYKPFPLPEFEQGEGQPASNDKEQVARQRRRNWTPSRAMIAALALEVQVRQRYDLFTSPPPFVRRVRGFAERNADAGRIRRRAVAFALLLTEWWEPEAALESVLDALAVSTDELDRTAARAASYG